MKKITIAAVGALFLAASFGMALAETNVSTQVSATTLANLPPLRMGDSNDSVKILQNMLIAGGYIPATVKATGYYGPATVAGVKKFQKEKGISPLGNVGPQTRAVLKSYFERGDMPTSQDKVSDRSTLDKTFQNGDIPVQDDKIKNPNSTGCTATSLFSSITGARCGANLLPPPPTTPTSPNTATISIDTITVTPVFADDAAHLTVTGKNLATVQVFGVMSGTGVTNAVQIGTAALRSATNGGVQTWTFIPPQNISVTSISAKGYDSTGTLVGTLTLPLTGVTAINTAFFDTTAPPTTLGAGPTTLGCAGVTGPALRLYGPTEGTSIPRIVPFTVTWKSCNMRVNDLVWIEIVPNSTGTELLLTPGAGATNDNSEMYALPSTFPVGTATLKIGMLAESPVGSGQRVFQAMAAIPNLTVY